MNQTRPAAGAGSSSEGVSPEAHRHSGAVACGLQLTFWERTPSGSCEELPSELAAVIEENRQALEQGWQELNRLTLVLEMLNGGHRPTGPGGTGQAGAPARGLADAA